MESFDKDHTIHHMWSKIQDLCKNGNMSKKFVDNLSIELDEEIKEAIENNEDAFSIAMAHMQHVLNDYYTYNN